MSISHVGCSCAWRPAAAEGPPSALDLAGGPRAQPKAALLARTIGRADLWALNDADRPGWRPAVAIGGLDLAEAEGIIEEELLESIEEAGDHSNAEHVEWSAVRGVVEWLRASNLAPRRFS